MAAQQLFLQLAANGNEVVRREATARCSQLLHQVDLPRLARPFDEQLATTWATVPCWQDLSGRACLQSWSKAFQAAAASENQDDILPRSGLHWPYGAVQVTEAGAAHSHRRRAGNRPSYLEVRLEHCDAILGSCNVLLGHQNRQVCVRDSQGREFFRTDLTQSLSTRSYGGVVTYGVARGNLLLISSGQQILAVDTLAPSNSERTEPTSDMRVLWRRRVGGDHRRGYVVHAQRRDGDRPGSYRAPRAQHDGRWLGVIGPVTSRSCVLQDANGIVCVDPLRGDLLWKRSDVPVGCDLFGDAEVVLVVEPRSTSARMLSTVDGRTLGRTTVPRWRERLATRGRTVIRWRKTENWSYELSSQDAVTGEVHWQQIFDRSSVVDIAESRFVAIANPHGQRVVIDAETGQRLVDATVSSCDSLQAVHLLAGSDHFTMAVQYHHLGTGLGQNRERASRVALFNAYDYVALDGQLSVFDRRTGRALFARPATVRQQAFMLAQPVDLPVIACAGNLPRQTNKGSGQKMRLLLLEKTSGRQLYASDELDTSVNHFSLYVAPPPGAVGDSHQSNVVVAEMLKQQVRLQFTPLPRAPEPPALATVTAGQQPSSQGLQGILMKRILGR